MRTIRVKKQDSAYLYAILESHEGLAAYSTLDGPPEAPFRDIELNIPPGREPELEALLKELGDLVYDIT